LKGLRSKRGEGQRQREKTSGDKETTKQPAQRAKGRCKGKGGNIEEQKAK